MDRAQRRTLAAGALLAAAGVACGAFGAHALRASLDPVRLSWWYTAVEYQMWHAMGLVAVASPPPPHPSGAAATMALGTAIFSGTLYVMALTDARWLGMVTPVGGALMILGWLWLALHTVRLGFRRDP